MMRILKWCRRYWLALLLVIAMGYLWMKADEAKRTAYAAWRTANEAESTADEAKRMVRLWLDLSTRFK